MKFKKSIKYFSSHIFTFTQNEIISKIPGEIFEKVKMKDEHPFFQIYSLCHEGIAKPTIEGKATPVKWTRKAIQSIKNIVLNGVKLFRGHNTTNENQDKKVLGEVIYDFQEEKDGKLHHFVITYHPQDVKEEVINYDVCSQESLWNFIESAGRTFADSIEKITGIALASSKKEQPAFSEARRLGFVQALEGEKMEINFREVKSYVDTHKVYPWQLYTEEDLKQDRLFGGVFKEHAEFKARLEKIEPEYNDLKKKSELLETDNKKLLRDVNLNSAGKKLETYITENKLSDPIKNFILKRFEKDKAKLDDFSDEKLKSYVVDTKELYQDIKGEEKKETNIPLISGDSETGKDYTKAANNPFLEEDFEEV